VADMVGCSMHRGDLEDSMRILHEAERSDCIGALPHSLRCVQSCPECSPPSRLADFAIYHLVFLALDRVPSVFQDVLAAHKVRPRVGTIAEDVPAMVSACLRDVDASNQRKDCVSDARKDLRRLRVCARSLDGRVKSVRGAWKDEA